MFCASLVGCQVYFLLVGKCMVFFITWMTVQVSQLRHTWRCRSQQGTFTGHATGGDVEVERAWMLSCVERPHRHQPELKNLDVYY